MAGLKFRVRTGQQTSRSPRRRWRSRNVIIVVPPRPVGFLNAKWPARLKLLPPADLPQPIHIRDHYTADSPDYIIIHARVVYTVVNKLSFIGVDHIVSRPFFKFPAPALGCEKLFPPYEYPGINGTGNLCSRIVKLTKINYKLNEFFKKSTSVVPSQFFFFACRVRSFFNVSRKSVLLFTTLASVQNNHR